MSEPKTLHVKAFLINRSESVSHIAKYDPFGEVAGSWCGQTQFDIESNVKWGNPACEACIAAATAEPKPGSSGPVCINCEATTFVCGACGARLEEA
jgi:hypothetical protein